MEVTINNVKIEAVKGDITKQVGFAAIVNAANAELKTGGGVAGAIHRSAGKGLAEEATKYAPIEPGEAVITGAHDLPNEYVIHCLGPVYGKDSPEDKLLAKCYQNALDLAEENNIKTIAFPAISTGAFGYPKVEATQVALDAIAEKVSGLEHVKHIRFVLFSDSDLEIFQEKLENFI